MRADVTLRPLDQALLAELLRAAVEDADPHEVMPPVEGPEGWTPERRAAFVRFHEGRSLAADPVEAVFAITASRRVVGAARLRPLQDRPGTVEAGMWIGRSHRGAGVGGAVLDLLLRRARADGFAFVRVRTKPWNGAVRALVARVGGDLVREGDMLTADLDLAAGARQP